jgi:SPW repeat
MSDFRFFNTHRTWEDWFGMLLGVLIMLSPWFPTEDSHGLSDATRHYIILNTFTVGVVIFVLAQLQYVALQRWEEVAEIFVGLWLIASPYVFGYSGDGFLKFWHSSLGGLVALLAALQLWQDWELSEQEMTRHGQS